MVFASCQCCVAAVVVSAPAVAKKTVYVETVGFEQQLVALEIRMKNSRKAGLTSFRGRLLTTGKFKKTGDRRQRRLLLLCRWRWRRLWALSLVLVVDLLWVCGVQSGRDGGGDGISSRLRLLVVGRLRWVLEHLAVPYAAVYHAGKMHCHGEGSSHEAQQRLRNVEVLGKQVLGFGGTAEV